MFILQIDSPDLSWLYEFGSAISIGIFVYVIYIIQNIKKFFPSSKIVKKWIILQVLLLVFIGAYIVDWALLWVPEAQIEGNLVYIFKYFTEGILRIAVAIFILLIVILIYKTYRLVLESKK